MDISAFSFTVTLINKCVVYFNFDLYKIYFTWIVLGMYYIIPQDSHHQANNEIRKCYPYQTKINVLCYVASTPEQARLSLEVQVRTLSYPEQLESYKINAIVRDNS